jgi:hypothetical protein
VTSDRCICCFVLCRGGELRIVPSLLCPWTELKSDFMLMHNAMPDAAGHQKTVKHTEHGHVHDITTDTVACRSQSMEGAGSGRMCASHNPPSLGSLAGSVSVPATPEVVSVHVHVRVQPVRETSEHIHHTMLPMTSSLTSTLCKWAFAKTTTQGATPGK